MPGAFVCASSSSSSTFGLRASAASRSNSSSTWPRYSILRRGKMSSPSSIDAVSERAVRLDQADHDVEALLDDEIARDLQHAIGLAHAGREAEEDLELRAALARLFVADPAAAARRDRVCRPARSSRCVNDTAGPQPDQRSHAPPSSSAPGDRGRDHALIVRRKQLVVGAGERQRPSRIAACGRAGRSGASCSPRRGARDREPRAGAARPRPRDCSSSGTPTPGSGRWPTAALAPEPCARGPARAGRWQPKTGCRSARRAGARRARARARARRDSRRRRRRQRASARRRASRARSHRIAGRGFRPWPDRPRRMLRARPAPRPDKARETSALIGNSAANASRSAAEHAACAKRDAGVRCTATACPARKGSNGMTCARPQTA